MSGRSEHKITLRELTDRVNHLLMLDWKSTYRELIGIRTVASVFNIGRFTANTTLHITPVGISVQISIDLGGGPFLFVSDIGKVYEVLTNSIYDLTSDFGVKIGACVGPKTIDVSEFIKAIGNYRVIKPNPPVITETGFTHIPSDENMPPLEVRLWTNDEFVVGVGVTPKDVRAMPLRLIPGEIREHIIDHCNSIYTSTIGKVYPSPTTIKAMNEIWCMHEESVNSSMGLDIPSE